MRLMEWQAWKWRGGLAFLYDDAILNRQTKSACLALGTTRIPTPREGDGMLRWSKNSIRNTLLAYFVFFRVGAGRDRRGL